MYFRCCRDTRQSHQFANRFAVEEDWDWAAGVVGELVAVVEAEVAADRGEHVLRLTGLIAHHTDWAEMRNIGDSLTR